MTVTADAAPPLATAHAAIDQVLEAWGDALGRDAAAYRGHVYRVFNFTRALAGTGDHDDAIAVAAAFHDLGIWADGTFDYLEPSARRAADHLRAVPGAIDADAVAQMIALHHKLTRCPADAGVLTEAFRRADLVDLSLGMVSFGLPRAFVSEVRAAFPNAGFHACLARVSSRWFVRHPTRPMPMMRW